MAPEELNQILPSLDADRRQFILRMLAGAWAAPLVASFSLGGLLAEPALGQGSNLCISSSNISTSPQVDVQKTVSAAEVSAGNNLTYTIAVQNCTRQGVASVSIVDPLPAGTTFEVYDKNEGIPGLGTDPLSENNMPIGKASIEVIRVGQNSSVLRWSTRIRLTSSGIFRLKERKPASICSTGMSSFAAANAPASVEFVSPNTITALGDSASRTSSIATSICPVIAPCDPP